MPKDFDPEFSPDLTPKQMLELGVFGGNYFQGDITEYPQDWFKNVKISDHGHDPSLNFFKVDASQPWLFGKRRAGYIQEIRGAGSSGIAAITWAGVSQTKISGRLNAGKP